MKSRRKRKRHQQQVAADLELMPMLNVFIAIIPLLLLSAAFVPVTVIQATLPGDAVAASEKPADEPLDLSIAILPDHYLVKGHGLEPLVIPRAVTEAPQQLAQALATIVAAHPGNKEVRIVSEPTTRYEEIIAVMDVSRAAGLPEAALADARMEAS